MLQPVVPEMSLYTLPILRRSVNAVQLFQVAEVSLACIANMWVALVPTSSRIIISYLLFVSLVL